MGTSRPITLAELNDLVASATSTRDRAYLLLSAASGARVNEIRLCRVSAILNPFHSITGKLVLTRKNTKGKIRTRTTPLPARALHALSEWLNVHPRPIPNAFLFPHPGDPDRPLHTRTLQRIVTDTAATAKLSGPVTSHSLRKFFGTRVYLATNFDIASTAQALGHRNPASTSAYLDLDHDLREIAIREIFHDPRDDLLVHEPPAIDPALFNL